ncbi:hypothetical protein RO03_07420 [Fusobacterium nucleatum subsp. nucleatum]|uniref:Uncharacterized protein n=1 Tax=Fusobacterium nucleatum subsp. nucleatum TaxID=76856 RepID=A0A0X3Y2V3_FUSNC|nr:hypothetical protein [Fusobacterium nucleatum]KUL99338.1 hypothetical protein RO03_07420 [Fusobacterium nucleatum subsp. nucleatum]
MNSIRALFSGRQTELINLKNIEGAVIREKEIIIVGVTGREYYYSDDPKMRNYIINFSEVEQILLNFFKE